MLAEAIVQVNTLLADAVVLQVIMTLSVPCSRLELTILDFPVLIELKNICTLIFNLFPLTKIVQATHYTIGISRAYVLTSCIP